MRDLIVDTGGSRGGLLTPAVMGTPGQVYEGLEQAVVLQHPGFGSLDNLNRDRYNRHTPSTVFHLSGNGSKLIGGGQEAGMMPMGEAAGECGLRPGVVDCRGEDWNCGPVRGLSSESPSDHAARGCPHFFARTNWMLKKFGPTMAGQMEHLTLILVTVATWLGEGRNVVCHCIPLLFPPRWLILINYLF